MIYEQIDECIDIIEKDKKSEMKPISIQIHEVD